MTQNQDSRKVTSSLKLLPAMRFGAVVLCLESVLANKHNLKTPAVNEEVKKELNSITKKMILEDPVIFWVSLDKVVKLLKPVASWITTLQGEKPILSVVMESLKDIERKLDKEFNSTNSSLQILTDNDIGKIRSSFAEREKNGNPSGPLCSAHPGSLVQRSI